MPLFEPVFAALNEAGVRYVVVGGVAVVLHGHARLTADLDVAIDLSPEAASDVMTALENLGLRPRLPVRAADLADPAVRARWVEEQGMQVFSLWDPDDPLRSVDVFVENPIDFDELWERSERVDLGGTGARIASIADLIRLKRLADGPQDRLDIEARWKRSKRHAGTSVGSAGAPGADGWAVHRETQLEASLTTTPAQRLRWLEEAIRFAFEAGALPDRRRDASDVGEPGGRGR